ncbi:phosphatase PAP2 family protein [Endozoicomonas sp.]|uniref:phosphatase PAP2 family protein n=1 Tax=Endozoicomonas sp. TaxID=1892382 RepID=UPI003AF48716
MTDLLQWGLDFVAWIQQYRNPVSDELMQHITDLGGKYYIYFLPLLIWCLNFRFVIRICTMFLLSFFINVCFKDVLTLPRPFDVDPDITPNREWGYGMPSGHSQNSALLWIMLAIGVAKRWFWFIALSIGLLIGFSRVYFGLHFPGDILGGWLLAGILLWAYYAWEDRVSSGLNKLSTSQLLAGFTFIMVGLGFLYMSVLEMPIMTGLVAISFGFGSGAIFTIRILRYNGFGSLWKRILRGVLGLSVLIFYLKFTGSLFPETKDLEYYRVLIIVNTIAGLWLSLGAPLIFSLLLLGGRYPVKN